MPEILLPDDVIDWFRERFSECNNRITQKLSLVPNTKEESLDMSFVEHFTQYGAPRTFQSGFTVRVDTHFLGGMRHWARRWEIADIGLLVHYRQAGRMLQSKAALLQSKRLYPEGVSISEDLPEDYELGFSRLSDPEDARIPLYMKSRYRFDENCRYGALRAYDEQYHAISQFMNSNQVPVFYQFYNPIELPHEQEFPQTGEECFSRFDLGTRIVPAQDVIRSLSIRPENYTPKIIDLAGSTPVLEYGWRLEYFVADLLLKCKQGYIFTDLSDESVFSLFNRRSGAIAAAISLSIDMAE